MTKILNNLDKVNYPAEQGLILKGWDDTPAYDGNRIARISDTVGGGIALEKMGTSIPTPFARIFMFKTAFEMVNASAAGADDNSAYGKLVSECLDFLEFIYNYGADITVKAWNVNDQINALKNSASSGHKKLGNALERFARDLSVRNIFLIYYHDKLIGGTSPFTLVYTSPNWKRIQNVNNAHGLNGNLLFPDYSNAAVNATPLYKRDSEFQVMLTRFYVAFRNIGNLGNTAFFKYVYNNQYAYSDIARNEFGNITNEPVYNTANFANDYSYLKVGHADADIIGLGGANSVFIATKNVTGDDTVSDDYKIDSTVLRNGIAQEPLVLSDQGITAATYINGQPFPEGTVISQDTTIALNDRILPGGMNIPYPYLTEADFFQEKLIKVGYKVDTANFKMLQFGCNAADYDYLLPLRKEIFDYFSPDDFGTKPNLKIAIVEETEDSVKVQLTIPVKCAAHPYIELEHIYYKEDMLELRAAPDVFSVAIFPSYKIVAGTVPNIYSVLISDEKKVASADYYAMAKNGINKVNAARSNWRQTNASKYDEIEQAFDFCEISYKDAKALLIPNFMEVNVDGGQGSTVVGIDFGTTNTYISYSTNDGASPHTLDITKEDMQVLTLNKIDLSEGNYGKRYKDSMYWSPSFNSAIDREFVPLLLGNDSDVSYPFRTVTCETGDFAGALTPQLFAHINVGFNFLKEDIILQNQSYNTSIKWDIEDDANHAPLALKENRIKAYCEQTVWMIKGKLMLLNEQGYKPHSQLTVFLTFPYTMRRTTKNAIEGFWKAAFDRHFGAGNVTIERVTESIAPYYYMIGNGGNFTDNALNIDIGGGTTDMLFADIKNQKFYYTSSKFAGNDIWGDGEQLVVHHTKDNGFVLDFEQKLNNGDINVSDQRRDGYAKYKQIVKNSSDLMSYIFRYDSEFRYCSYIAQSHDKFVPILCIHIGAILYHVAQVLKEKNMEIPSTIRFSGMGSKYLYMISSNSQDIEDIVKQMLSTFINALSEGQDEIRMPRNFKVKFQEKAKESTAQGAMLVGHGNLTMVNNYTEYSLCVYGVPTDTEQLTYGDVPRYKDNLIKEFGKFLSLFAERNKMTDFLKNEFNIVFRENLLDKIRKAADESFNLMSKVNENGGNREQILGEDVNETMFFWPLKNGLFEASK